MKISDNTQLLQTNNKAKKQWKKPLIVEISRVDIEKGAVANNESTWVPGFTPFAQYHS